MTDLSRVPWRKSRRSTQQGDCVEVADLRATAPVRDSDKPDAPRA